MGKKLTVLTEETTPIFGDALYMVDDPSGSPASKYVLMKNLFQYMPDGTMLNGKLSPTVASNNLTLALKTKAGSDPSATDPVLVKINGSVRTVTAALSVTVNAGTSIFNAGSSELAAQEINLFAYIGYNATDGTVLGFSRIPYATNYSDFSTTSTNEKYCAISTITTAAATDDYVNVGRFAATNSGTASYNWSVPTFTTANLIQRPIYEGEWKSWTPTISVGYSANPTDTVYVYKFKGKDLHFLVREATNGTSNTTSSSVYSLPFTALTLANAVWMSGCWAVDNGANVSPFVLGFILAGGTTITWSNFAGWTASGGRRIAVNQSGSMYRVA